MSHAAAQPLVVTTVFSAVRHAHGARRGSVRLLGLFTLAVCAAWTYVAWWPVDRYLLAVKLNFVLDASVADQVGRMGAAGVKDPLAAMLSTLLPSSRPAEDASGLMTVERGQALQREVVKHGTAFFSSLGAWYVLVSATSFVLATAAGAALVGRFPGRRRRLQGLSIALLMLAALAAMSAGVYQRYGLAYPVQFPRYGVLMLIVACLGAGMLISGGGRWLHGAAAVVTLLAAVGTLVAIYVATTYGELRDPVINASAWRYVVPAAIYPAVVWLWLRLSR